MKKHTLAATLSCLLLSSCVTAYASVYSGSYKSAVRLSGKSINNFCSATAVSPTTLLTAEHCFVKGSKPNEILINGKSAVVLSYEFDGNDNALIVVNLFNKDWLRLKPNSMEVGEDVYFFGNPPEFDRLLRKGYVAGRKPTGLSVLDINGWFGDSGAGIVDSNGYIVGVINSIFLIDLFTVMGSEQLRFTTEQYKKARVVPVKLKETR